MFLKLTGQSEVISLVMITGIIIGLVSTAYLWGAPLIEKRSATIDVEIGKEFMSRLDKKVIDIANQGAGEAILEIPIGFLTLVPNNTNNPNNNSLMLELSMTQQMIFPDTIVYLGNSRDEIGVYGKTESSIITLEGSDSDNNFRALLKSHYRELDTNQTTPIRGFKIILTGTEERRGNSQVTISFGGMQTFSNAAANGGDLIITYVDINTF